MKRKFVIVKHIITDNEGQETLQYDLMPTKPFTLYSLDIKEIIELRDFLTEYLNKEGGSK